MEYQPFRINSVIDVESIVTVHYFQFARGYVFSGERHEFWEMVYMDKGSAEIGADDTRFMLCEGEAYFHKPGEFHTIWAGGEKAPDIVVVSFVCLSSAMEHFKRFWDKVDEAGKAWIAQIIVEAKNAWQNKLGADYLALDERQNSPAGSAQMVRISLEALLIRFLRKIDAKLHAKVDAGRPMPPARSGTAMGRREYLDGLAVIIEQYIDGHMEETITISSLCRRFNMSATSLKRMFRLRNGGGVNQYLAGVRHEAAKRHIREGRLNMTAIAEKCGFHSVHYFSRRFSELEEMTPSEYARSVKGLSGFSNSIL